MQSQHLLERARQALVNAYAPYSRLQVGAAVLSAAGNVYAGCNVENAAFPSGGCAEHHAIAAAVCAEGPGLDLVAVAVAARGQGGEQPIVPCGACRQRIREFGQDARVISAGADGGVLERSIAELLPDGFRFPAP
jgi:cytidine deaminase